MTHLLSKKGLSRLFPILGLGLWASCNSQPNPQAAYSPLNPMNLHGVEVFTHQDSVNAPEFSKEPNVYDFGTINDGDIIHHVFHFRNVGHSPLVIKNIKPSCGCTAVDFTHRPVAVSDTGSFNIQFNSKGKYGPQTKIITIFANTIPRVHQVIIRGIVNAKQK
jgi:hypothetical protein